MSKHKNQHFVPRSYLAAWCDPKTPSGYEPYVWRFPKDGSKAENKAPANIFTETEAYTILRADGQRDLRLEHGLKQMEDNFLHLRNGPLSRREELDAEDSMWLLGFVAAMHSRTMAMRRQQAAQWGRVLEIADDLMASVEKQPVKERKRIPSIMPREGPSLTHEQVRQIAQQPLQTLMVPLIAAETRRYAQMSVAMYVTVESPGFITSDDPCIWFVPRGMPRLNAPMVEVTLPLSPTLLIMITNHKELSGWFDASPTLVEHFNRRTRTLCDEHFVVNRDFSDPAWFDVDRLLEPYRK